MKAPINSIVTGDPGIQEAVLNSLRDQICLIDITGNICFTNNEWNRFMSANGGTTSSCGLGANYLRQSEMEPSVYQGLQEVLAGKTDGFNFEYPCHSPAMNRWFLMQATPLQANADDLKGVVIRHVDITKQKLLELRLKDYAEKDTLTSLFNRRHFEEQLSKKSALAFQYSTSISLLYIDIDNFKEINDAYGHPVGDQVLKQLGDQIANAARFSDTAARIGGDEFAILLPGTTKTELELIANRLVDNIHTLEIREKDIPISITVSIGGKIFTDDFPIDSMAKWVDKALYSAKEKGKNQVVIL